MRRLSSILAHVCVPIGLLTAPPVEDRLWPVPLDPGVSSNFCEQRDGRFHAGIDVRTYGSEGIPCRAIADGHISRMRAASRGYGKALHLTLTTGEQVVYAHLAEFSPALEDTLDAEQTRTGRYGVDLRFEPRRYPVRRGDVIGYSGSTGATAPHLHLETRTAADEPVNPFRRGLALPDKLRPSFSRVVFVPLSDSSSVEGARMPMEGRITGAGAGRYTVEDTLSFSGPVGVAVSAVDRLNSNSGRLAPYELQVWADDSLVTRIVFEHFAFEDVGEVDLLYHAGALRARGATVAQLFQRDGESMGRREFSRGGRVAPPQAGASRRVHRVRVVALDVAGNRAELDFYYKEGAGDPGRGRPAVRAAALFAVDLEGAFFHDGFAIVPVRDPRNLLRERTHESEHEAHADTVVLRAADLMDRVQALPMATMRDTATVYVTGVPAAAHRVVAFAPLGASVNVPAGALYTDAVVYATRSHTARARSSPGIVRRGDAVRVGPIGLALRQSFTIRLQIDAPGERDAIFRYDDYRGAWLYLASARDSTGISASASRPGVFAVMRDEVAPTLGAPRVETATSYATGETFHEVHIPVDDRGSGLDDGRIEVTVADRAWPARWNFAAKKIVVALRREPIIGEQPVRVVVYDRIGNRSERSTTLSFNAR